MVGAEPKGGEVNSAVLIKKGATVAAKANGSRLDLHAARNSLCPAYTSPDRCSLAFIYGIKTG